MPASAVLIFDIEMIEMEAGLPDGYMFIWNEDVSADLFTEMDADKDLRVLASEVLITAKPRPQLHANRHTHDSVNPPVSQLDRVWLHLSSPKWPPLLPLH